MAKKTYFKFPYKVPKQFQDLDDSYEHVQVLHNRNEDADRKVMIVFDRVPKEDMKSGNLLGGYTGETLKRMSDLAKKMFKSTHNLDNLDYLAFNFSLFKTYGKDKDFQQDANELFKDRLEKAILKYKPDVVLTFGRDSFQALNSDSIVQAKGAFPQYFGTTISTKIRQGKTAHKFQHVPTLPLHALLGDGKHDMQETSYLLGYCARNMVTAFEGKMRYKMPKITKDGKPYINKKGKAAYTARLIDTIPKLKKLLATCAKAPYVSVDTETENLNRIKNQVQTVQMLCDPKNPYIIPIYHKDTPFSPKELKKVVKLLRDYFETQNNNIYQIFVNGKFDLNVMRSNFGIRYYKADIWDVQAGEFVLDENMKLLHSVTGYGYYALGNLTVQYGCKAYLESAFGKENRKTISSVDLDEALIDYCALDIVVPFYIFEQQLQRAKDIGYVEYERMVGKQVSDQIQVFSVLESTGARADIEYLFKLKLPNSPINEALKTTEEKLYQSSAIHKANEILADQKHMPKKGLFGAVTAKLFSFRKSEHKQVLFFDVLKLKGLDEGKKKRPNGKMEWGIGKDFQNTYDSVPEVKWYNEYTKIKKLRDAFVNALLKHWGKDDDFKHDVRIRPNYSYLKVVTGRTSASNPNLQQIPSRSKLGKHIKRLFIAGEGKILIKVDYSAHEVRGWSIISGDVEVAKAFAVGTVFRDRFKMLPDPYIARRIELDGDVHKINAAYFFGIDIAAVVKEVRNSVKTVIFGLIYQQSLKNLAKQIGRPLKEVETIVAKFLKRFPVGVKWFDKAKAEATKRLYVQSPLGRRRNLWGMIIPKSVPESQRTHAACLRRAVNSPVQGFGSDLMMIGIRNIDRFKFEHLEKTGYYPDMELTVSVHDSLTVEVKYDDFWLALDFIDRGLTSEVVKKVNERYPDFKFISEPEVDFEIGPNERDVQEWDFSHVELQRILKDTLTFQKKEMKHRSDMKDAYQAMTKRNYKHMPSWMKKQVHALKIPMKDLGDDIRSKEEKKLCKKWIKEIPGNAKLLSKMNEEIEERTKLAEIEKLKAAEKEEKKKGKKKK